MQKLSPIFHVLFVIGLLFVSGGATCARRAPTVPFPPPPPIVLGDNPSLEQITGAINRTASIEQLSTNTAKVEVVNMPNLPTLDANVNITRPKNFRLKAKIPLLLGTGLDMGSNQEMFWFEVPEGISKTLYFARHDQYSKQLTRAIFPVDPTFLIDALGLVQIDPTQVVAGPVWREDGKIEIQTAQETPGGTYRRIFFIEPQALYVTEQFVYDPAGKLVARSSAGNHVYYNAQNVVLPHQLRLELIASSGQTFSLKIDVSNYVVNQLLSGDPNLFNIPTGAAQVVDLSQATGAAIGGQPSFPTTQHSIGSTTGAGSSPAANAQPSFYAAEALRANPIRGYQ